MTIPGFGPLATFRVGSWWCHHWCCCRCRWQMSPSVPKSSHPGVSWTNHTLEACFWGFWTRRTQGVVPLESTYAVTVLCIYALIVVMTIACLALHVSAYAETNTIVWDLYCNGDWPSRLVVRISVSCIIMTQLGQCGIVITWKLYDWMVWSILHSITLYFVTYLHYCNMEIPLKSSDFHSIYAWFMLLILWIRDYS